MNIKDINFKIQFQNELDFYKHNYLPNIFHIYKFDQKTEISLYENKQYFILKNIMFTIMHFIFFNKSKNEFKYLFKKFKKFHTKIEFHNFCILYRCFINPNNIEQTDKYLFELTTTYLQSKLVIKNNNSNELYKYSFNILLEYLNAFRFNKIYQYKTIKQHIIFLLLQTYNIFNVSSNCYNIIYNSLNNCYFFGENNNQIKQFNNIMETKNLNLFEQYLNQFL